MHSRTTDFRWTHSTMRQFNEEIQEPTTQQALLPSKHPKFTTFNCHFRAPQGTSMEINLVVKIPPHPQACFTRVRGAHHSPKGGLGPQHAGQDRGGHRLSGPVGDRRASYGEVEHQHPRVEGEVLTQELDRLDLCGIQGQTLRLDS